MASQEPTRAQLVAAITAINCHGFDIAAPWDGDLDDRELEEFNGLKAAISAAMKAIHDPETIR